MNTHDEVKAYWLHPEAENAPKKYLGARRKERSLFLIETLRQMGITPSHAILEIGCNSGRNLMYLWKAGYHRLAGIEINPEAVALMREKLPYLRAEVVVGPVEEVLKTMEQVDVIFTLAVLVHIHPEGDFIFGEMVDKVKKVIVTIEDEVSDKARHCPRNYGEVFEGLGMKQVFYAPTVPGMNLAYCARAFKKKRARRAG